MNKVYVEITEKNKQKILLNEDYQDLFINHLAVNTNIHLFASHTHFTLFVMVMGKLEQIKAYMLSMIIMSNITIDKNQYFKIKEKLKLCINDFIDIHDECLEQSLAKQDKKNEKLN